MFSRKLWNACERAVSGFVKIIIAAAAVAEAMLAPAIVALVVDSNKR